MDADMGLRDWYAAELFEVIRPQMNTECAGINRRGIGNERVLQERNSEPS
jgi:hypothetical protein